MADYVSKYTGSEVDGILDEAIELPQGSSEDVGKFLKYGNNGLEWDNPIDTRYAHADEFLKYDEYGNLIWETPLPVFTSYDEGQVLKVVAGNDEGTFNVDWEDPIDTTNAHHGEFLKYSSTTGIMWDDVPSIDTTNAHNGEFLKYSSTTGIMWDNVPGIDTTHAYNGDFLKYSSTSGIIWDDVPGIDTTNAQVGDVLTYGVDGITWDSVPSGSSIDTTNAYDGAVLKYDNGSGVIWADPIDTNGADGGQLLAYSCSVGLHWADPPTDSFKDLVNSGWNGAILSCVDNSPSWINIDFAIPTYDTGDNSSDAGKILTVNSSGFLSWCSLSDIQSNNI